MISAGEIVILAILILLLAYAIWWFVIVYRYGKSIIASSYTRGANLDTATGKSSVTLTCDASRQICLEQATAICTGSVSAESSTEAAPEPISAGPYSNGANGTNSTYGQFDVNNTVDLTKFMAERVNGHESTEFLFNGTGIGLTCPSNYNPKDGSGIRPQLIATYTCIPVGTQCKVNTSK